MAAFQSLLSRLSFFFPSLPRTNKNTAVGKTPSFPSHGSADLCGFLQTHGWADSQANSVACLLCNLHCNLQYITIWNKRVIFYPSLSCYAYSSVEREVYFFPLPKLLSESCFPLGILGKYPGHTYNMYKVMANLNKTFTEHSWHARTRPSFSGIPKEENPLKEILVTNQTRAYGF